MTDGEALHELAGLVSQLQEDGREGAVEPDTPRQGSGGLHVASGGVEFDAQSQLPQSALSTTAVKIGSSQSDHGDGAQAGPDLLHGDAVRRGVSEAEFDSDHRKRMEKNLHRRAKELGYELQKIEGAVSLLR